MKRTFITLILVFSVFFAEANNRKDETKIIKDAQNETQYNKLVEFAKTYMDKNTEYAFNCAYKAQVWAEENKDKAKSAECHTIMGNIFEKCESYPTAISYYEKAIEDLIALKDYLAIYKMYIKIAQLYQNGEFNDTWCIDAMNNALTYAKKTNNPNAVDETNLAFGDLYTSLNKHELAVKHYDETLKKNIDKTTIRSISTALSKKANLLIKERDYTNALQLIDSSLYLCIRDFNNSLQVINYCYKAKIYDTINDIESAKKYYIQAAKLAYANDDFNSSGNIMFRIAYLNKRVEDYDNAIGVFKILCDSTEKYKMYDICYLAYYQLSQCYASMGKYEEAYNLFNKYDIYYDSLYKIFQEKQVEHLRSSYLLSMNIKELKSKEIETENKRNNKKEWIIIFGIIIVLLTALVTYIILYTKNKSLIHKNDMTAYEQQLKIDKMENDLMEYQLKSNRELLIHLAFNLKSYIEVVNPLKDEMKKILDSPDNELKNKIKDVYSNLQNNIRMFSNTDNLHKRINAVYKDFLDRLDTKHPGLTKAEKKLCIMLYINMSSKDIAIMTNTTIRSVETSRYRLRKKFNLTREDDIVSFLQDI